MSLLSKKKGFIFGISKLKQRGTTDVYLNVYLNERLTSVLPIQLHQNSWIYYQTWFHSRLIKQKQKKLNFFSFFFCIKAVLFHVVDLEQE